MFSHTEQSLIDWELAARQVFAPYRARLEEQLGSADRAYVLDVVQGSLDCLAYLDARLATHSDDDLRVGFAKLCEINRPYIADLWRAVEVLKGKKPYDPASLATSVAKVNLAYHRVKLHVDADGPTE